MKIQVCGILLIVCFEFYHYLSIYMLAPYGETGHSRQRGLRGDSHANVRRATQHSKVRSLEVAADQVAQGPLQVAQGSEQVAQGARPVAQGGWWQEITHAFSQEAKPQQGEGLSARFFNTFGRSWGQN